MKWLQLQNFILAIKDKMQGAGTKKQGAGTKSSTQVKQEVRETLTSCLLLPEEEPFLLRTHGELVIFFSFFNFNNFP